MTYHIPTVGFPIFQQYYASENRAAPSNARAGNVTKHGVEGIPFLFM